MCVCVCVCKPPLQHSGGGARVCKQVCKPSFALAPEGGHVYVRETSVQAPFAEPWGLMCASKRANPFCTSPGGGGTHACASLLCRTLGEGACVQASVQAPSAAALEGGARACACPRAIPWAPGAGRGAPAGRARGAPARRGGTAPRRGLRLPWRGAAPGDARGDAGGAGRGARRPGAADGAGAGAERSRRRRRRERRAW